MLEVEGLLWEAVLAKAKLSKPHLRFPSVEKVASVNTVAA